MSSSTAPAKPVEIKPDAPQGLSIKTFLSTLDWLSQSHPAPSQPDPAIQPLPKCIACKQQVPASSSDDVVGAVDHLEATLSFRVGLTHFLAFSPLDPDSSAAQKFPAVLSVVDANFRLALQVEQPGDYACFTLNTSQMLQQPNLFKTDKTLSLQLMFPFVTLVFEREIQSANPQNAQRANTPPDSYAIRFAAMQDAVRELREKQIELGKAADAEPQPETAQPSTVASCYQTSLKRKRSQWESSKMPDMQQMFQRFMSAGTALVMPLAFPYKFPRPTAGGLSMNQQMHQDLVESFVEVEAIREAVVKQASACVELAMKPRLHSEDKMLSKAEMEERKKAATQQLERDQIKVG